MVEVTGHQTQTGRSQFSARQLLSLSDLSMAFALNDIDDSLPPVV